MPKELGGLEEIPKAEIHLDLFRTALKRISNWISLGHDEIYGFWLNKIITIHDRQALEMNKCLQGVHVPR